MENILFRADSSSTIGTGHIMRDLVLADQFKDAHIMFATQNLQGNINHKIEEKNYKIKLLDSNNIEEIINLIHQYSIDMIVIDHYEIDYNYEKALKEKTGVKIFVLDDMYEKHYCNILLNHNIYADTTRYKGLVPKYCELRCGTQFTLLRNEFLEEKKKNIVSKNSIFIGMGGVDAYNITQEILKVLVDLSNSPINIVTTTSNSNLKTLEDFVLTHNTITLHINSNNIATLMNESFLAIVTPSVILNELFYMEVPFIAVQTANNQKEMISFLQKEKYSVLKNFTSKELTNLLQEKLAKNITLINFINLTRDEKKMILAWRNHPNINKWMFTQAISLDEHLNYIESLNTKEDRFYFLVKKGSQDIGVIDFTDIDYKNKRTAFGIYANPALKGMGNLLMESIINHAFNILKVNTLISEVFEDNIPAHKLYKKYNFLEIGTKKVNGKNIISMELNNENR